MMKTIAILLITILCFFTMEGFSQDYYANTPPRSTIPTDQASIQKGQDLFSQHCDKCHQLEKQEIGPALASVTDRRPVSWLLDWIGNSQEVIASGNSYANYLFESYNGYVMPAHEFLSKEDKLAIMAYLQHASGAPTHVSGTSSGKE